MTTILLGLVASGLESGVGLKQKLAFRECAAG
jgi:hypothetical protein